MKESRVEFLELNLGILNYPMAYEALKLVKAEMCKEKGFVRHNGAHYYYHPVDVAQHLLNSRVHDEDIITAALLHDIQEDVLDRDGTSKFNTKVLTEMFNENVAYMVNRLSKKPNIDYKTNEEAMTLYLYDILKNLGTCLIKTSDNIHNIGTLLDAPPEKRIRKALESEKFFIPFFKSCRQLYPWYSAFFFEAKTFVEPQIQLIKLFHNETTKLQDEVNELKRQIK